MADPNDITSSIEANDADVLDLKKAHFAQAGVEGTRMAAPVKEQNGGLNLELLNMLKIGKKYANFQGIDRCIRVLDTGTDHAHHCGAMMVKNLTLNTLMCTSCDRIKDPNANPKVINSSMIRLSNKELEECGLNSDPLLNAKPEPVVQPKKVVKKEAVEPKPRTAKVKTPNSVKIEVTMEELRNNPDVVKVMLQKTLDAIFDLPVSNFREAEAIRVVKDKVEAYLKGE